VEGSLIGLGTANGDPLRDFRSPGSAARCVTPGCVRRSYPVEEIWGGNHMVAMPSQYEGLPPAVPCYVGGLSWLLTLLATRKSLRMRPRAAWPLDVVVCCALQRAQCGSVFEGVRAPSVPIKISTILMNRQVRSVWQLHVPGAFPERPANPT
jgi:hypothetical protein